jgi:NADPH-dependent 2,4-dienoyl-CoA reductase/sulfur reductase-like enzyme
MNVEVLVVGAGPAGLACATECAQHGLSVALVDEQPSPGGQIYRGIADGPLAGSDLLGDDYRRGAAHVDGLRRSGAHYLPRTPAGSVAARAEGGQVALSTSRSASVAHARAIVIATGALERPFPVPGWTLPGVVMAGAAQSLLKTSAIVAKDGVVLAGNGPLLWLVAWQYLRAGAPPTALLDTTPRGRLARALRHSPGFLASSYFGKGLALVREVRRRVPVVEYVDALEIVGDDAARAVRYRAGDRPATVEVAHVLLHQGVVPDINLASALGCALEWDDANACFRPAVDGWGGTSLAGVYIAGDGAGIAGADAAAMRGRLAALGVANAQGRLPGDERDRLARPIQRALAQALRGRRFLDALYRPADAFRVPQGDTIACRCEEVRAATVARAAREGFAGPNQAKAYTRSGMGPCQGRYCALTLTEIVARETSRSPAQVGALRARFPTKPVTLAEIASLPVPEAARRAVAR